MCCQKRIEKKTIVIGKGSDVDLDAVKEQLEAMGVDLDQCCHGEGEEGARVKFVCVSPDLKESVEEMGHSPRDRVIMVRVDEETSRKLDDWVVSGAVKSRSEAAALFIREGLKVRNSELDRLRDALNEVETAKARLREKTREVFGEESNPESD